MTWWRRGEGRVERDIRGEFGFETTITPSPPLGKSLDKTAGIHLDDALPLLSMMSEDQGTTTTTTGQPAWRFIWPFYFLIATVLVLAGWAAQPLPPLPTQARLMQIEPTLAVPYIQAELMKADTGRALAEGDLERTTRFLSLQARAAGMHISEVTFLEGVVQNGITVVDAEFFIDGSPYHLPIFLDGLYRQRTINHLLSVSAEGGGQYIRFNILLRYYRPAHSSVTWLPDRLAMEPPLTEEQRYTLELAARLMEWRHFRRQERRLVEEAEAVRKQTAQQLVASLIAMRDGQGSLSWHHQPTQDAP